MMVRELNIVIVGLTGQGVIMATRMLSTALLADGQKVLVADVPPTSHRYTLNYSFLRVGDGVQSATVSEGEADLIIGLEPFECLKVGSIYARQGGIVLMNDKAIDTRVLPIPLAEASEHKYPSLEEIEIHFRNLGVERVEVVEASEIAHQEVGRRVAANMVMLGASYATDLLPVKLETLENAVEEFSPKGTAEQNLKAFRAGMKSYQDTT